MSGFCRSVFVVLLWAGISTGTWGQTARSPFTTFGIGDNYSSSLATNQGMGGTGVAQPQYWYLNNQNPALLVFNNLTVFQAGIQVENRTLRGDTASERSRGGNMNYLATAFPIKPGKWYTSIGLMPLTSVNFEFLNEDFVTNSAGAVVDTLTTRESGAGGLANVYWSNGIRLSPDFSIGLKAAYVFGSMANTYSNQLFVPGQLYNTTINIEEKTIVRDFQFTGGFSFSKDSLGRKQDKRLSVGLTYTFNTELSARKNDFIYRTNTTGTDTIESYTIANQPGTITLPESFTIGIAYARGLRWSVSAEYSARNYSKFRSINSDDEGLGVSWRAATGFEITPDPAATEKLLKKTTYRTGLSYEKLPFFANGNEVKDFGINFGFSFPAGRSSLDLAFKVGKRGDRKVNLLEENYFKVYFGITFNDQWFVKRKFD